MSCVPGTSPPLQARALLWALDQGHSTRNSCERARVREHVYLPSPCVCVCMCACTCMCRACVHAPTDLGDAKGVAQVQHAVHVGVGEVAKELALRVRLACGAVGVGSRGGGRAQAKEQCRGRGHAAAASCGIERMQLLCARVRVPSPLCLHTHPLQAPPVRTHLPPVRPPRTPCPPPIWPAQPTGCPAAGRAGRARGGPVVCRQAGGDRV